MRTTSIGPPHPTQPGNPARLLGAVRTPALLSMSTLRSMPQRETTVSFECRTSGPRRHHFSGPLLIDVLQAAQPLFETGERKARLRFLVAIQGRDGHRTVLAWGDIDPEFGNIPVLLAVSMDCRRLDAEGPHLVMPGDICGGRHISRVTDIKVCADDRLWE
jgi:hypothetical protein